MEWEMRREFFPGKRKIFFRELALLQGNLERGVFPPSNCYPVIKTVADYLFAFLFLTISFPFWLMIMAWIKLDSPGPLFFRQCRAGFRGMPFIMYKFRSMYSHVDPDAPTPLTPHDPRITPIGRIIRRFGLDEIPQLINVLRGEMSLVGPRPEMLFIVKRYNDIERKRLLVKPGLTGLWQIMGRKDKPIHEDLMLDLFYIKKQSFSWDMFILFETIPGILMSRIIW